MNKVFRVIFNHATQTWVAVSELGKAHGKSSSKTDKRVSLSKVALATATALMGAEAFAAVAIESTGANGAVTTGGTAVAGTSTSIVIGQNVITPASGGHDIVIGVDSQINSSRGGAGGTIIMGQSSTSGSGFGDVILGSYSMTGSSLGYYNEAGGPGGQRTVVGGRGFAYGDQSTVIGSDATATGDSSIAIGGDDITKAMPALAKYIPEFTATTNQLLRRQFDTIWDITPEKVREDLLNTKLLDANGNGIGYGFPASGTRDTAAANLRDTPFLRTWAAGAASTAMGHAAQTYGAGSHAIGLNAIAYSHASNAIGVFSRAGDGTSHDTSVETSNANAFGTWAQAKAKDSNAFGHNASVDAAATGGIAFGTNTSVTAENNVALGAESNEKSTTNAIGGQGNAIDEATVGPVTYSGFEGEDKLGGVVSVGNGDLTRQVINVAPGEISSTSTDAINGSQLYTIVRGMNWTTDSPNATGNTVSNTDKTDTGIHSGSHVNFEAGANLEIEKDVVVKDKGETTVTYTYKTSLNPTFENITTGGDVTLDEQGNPVVENPITIGKDKDGNNTITGLDSTIPSPAGEPSATKPDNIDEGKVATLGDVLNAGWNLEVEGEAVDLVTPYDIVNFLGDGPITVTADPATDNTKSNVKIGVDMSATVGDSTTAETPAPDAKAGKVAPLTNPDALMSAQSVADAINASGFTLKNSSVRNGTAPNADVSELINPGDTIEMIAGLNMKVEQEAEGGKITYSTVENPTFSNITTGGDLAYDEDGNPIVVNPITIGKDDAGNNAITGLDTTLPDPEGKAAGTKPADINSSQAATLGDVLNAGWNLQVEGNDVDLVTPYDIVNFIGEGVVSVEADPATDNTLSNVKIKVDTSGEVVDSTKVGGDLPEDAAPGKVAPKNPNALMTAEEIANAINASGFTLKHSATDGEDLGGDEELINPGDVIEMIAGKNLEVKQEADGKITYSTVMNPTFDNVTAGNADAPIYMGTNEAGDNVITGLAPTLPNGKENEDGSPVTNLAAPTNVDSTQAATLGDVLNAGWNLQAEGEAVDFVTPYDTVNFVGINGIEVKANPESDGSLSTIEIGIAKAGSVVDESVANPAEPAEGEEPTEPAAPTGKVAPNGDPDAIMTAQAVADAINASGFTLKNSANGGEAPTSDVSELINPGDVIEMIAGNNMEVKQEAEGGKITYSTVMNPTFDNVTAGNADAPIYMGTNEAGDNVITGLAPTLPNGDKNEDGSPVTNVAKPANIDSTQAATLGDVLNAGWNLQVEGAPVDLVTPYNTVNFKGINGIEVKANPESDGELSTIEIGIAKAGSVVDESVANPAEPAEGEEPAPAAPATGKVAPNGDPDAIMTAQAVADAINASGFTLKNSAKGGEAPTADVSELINPGDTIEMIAGANLKVEQEAEGGKITYSTVMNPTFENITTGGNVTFDENGNPVVENPIYMGQNDKGANVITGLDTTLPDPSNVQFADPALIKNDPNLDTTQAATLGDVLNAGWNLQRDGQNVDLVTPYDIVNFVAGNGVTITHDTDGTKSNLTFSVELPSLPEVITPSVAGSDTINVEVTEDENGNPVYNVAANTSPVVANENGSVDAPANPNALATAGDVANAINNSGWNATSGATGTGVVSGTTTELVKPSEEVKFIAGDNMVLEQNGQEFTYSVNPNPTFTTVTAEEGVTVGKGDTAINMTPVTTVTNNGEQPATPAISMNGAQITDLAPNLPVTTSVQDGDISPTTAQTIDPSQLNTSNAATLGDVLNAGWNLQANGNAVDFVKPYDTVNIAAGNGISVTPSTDGTKSTLTIAAQTSPLEMEGATATNPAGNGKVATPANPNALATAGDVANAINNSGFDLDVGADANSNGKVSANDTTAARVNPGKKVTVNAGRNIEISRSGTDITVATSNDPVFNSVQVGGSTGPRISSTADGDVKVAKADGSAARITNVAPGKDPTDAVNVSQLRGAVGDVNKRLNKLNRQRKAGHASGVAAASLMQAYREGQSVVTAGVGQYQGQAAVAVGYSRISDNGKYGIKLSVGANTQKELSAGASVGYFW